MAGSISMEPYPHHYSVYGDLKKDPADFRLVKIYPGVHPNWVVASLAVYALKTPPPYEALSYVWGPFDPEDPGVIELDGYTFGITTNLWRALFYLRSGTDEKIFWIDAICIYQNDFEERSSQVQLMRDIYKGAKQTAVWLGPHESLSSIHLLGFLKNIESHRVWANDAERNLAEIDLQTRLAADKSLQRTVRYGLYGDIAQCEFWTRIWVIQEVAISPNVMICCGNDRMSWEKFSGSVYRLDQAANLVLVDSYPDFGGLPNVETLSIMRELLSHDAKLALGDILALLRRCRATDPRDMIYGLLGLLSGCSIKPDYIQATAQDVYMNLVEYCFTEEKSLDIVTLCRRFSSTMELPSWVPNWTECWDNTGDPDDIDLPSSPLVLRYKTGELLRSFTDFNKPELLLPNAKAPILKAWSAHGSMPPVAVIHKSSSQLIARGVHIGTTAHLGDFTNRRERDGHLFFFDVMSDWEEIVLKSFGNCHDESNQKSIMDVFDRCLEIMDSHLSRNHTEFKKERDDKFQKRKEQRIQRESKYRQSQTKYLGNISVVEAFIRTIITDLDEDYQRVTSSKYARFWEIDVSQNAEWGLEIFALETATNRRLLVTDNGYIGLGPIKAEKGDHICIIYGCSVPLMLREVDGWFKLIGEVYMHGLMDGEAVLLEKAGNLVEKEWSIV